MSASEAEQLATTFATIARELEAAAGSEKTREVITRHAVEQVPGCSYAAISLIQRDGSVSTVAATHEIARRVDQVQFDTGEGPCLAAFDEHVVVAVDDLRYEQRWSAFSRRAADETGIASMLAFRLFTADDVTGSLNLYSLQAHAFTERSRTVGAVLAAHAAIALLATRDHEEIQNLNAALHSNRQIGVAIGIVMATQKVSQDEAFDFLRNLSQRLNHKLRDIAAVIVEEGGIPEATHSDTGASSSP